MIRAEIDGSFESWQREARRLLAAGVTPHEIVWVSAGAAQGTLEGIGRAAAPASHGDSPRRFTVPRLFLTIARDTALHRNDEKWPLLYRLLWRLSHENRRLLAIESDADVRKAQLMAQEVRRDQHKMHAFVRFRRVDASGDEHYVAWYRPDHLIVDAVAPFFIERFRAMRWSILTPDRSVHWNGAEPTFSDGVNQRSAPSEDELEELWRTYYRAVFNPARVNLQAMRAEMPSRHWATLPETRALPELLAAAPARVKEMIERGHDAPSARPFVPADASLGGLSAAAQTCRGCDLYQRATQVVFGNGAPDARVMLVGEQPGDQEDLTGTPFVGPAGEILQRAMLEAGLERRTVYLTNAVKHFKWEPRGKRRIHQTPRLSEVRACRPWLEAEITAIAPRLIVCLGSTAAQALMGPQFRITKSRGQMLTNPWADMLIATYHPSAVLRAETPEHADEVYRLLVSDLALAARQLSSPA